VIQDLNDFRIDLGGGRRAYVFRSRLL